MVGAEGLAQEDGRICSLASDATGFAERVLALLEDPDAAAAMAWLSKHPSCTGHVGVAGYCWGGLLAYLTAVRHKPEAAVSYYGVGIEQKLGLAKNLACPLLLHFAELDKYAPPAVIAQVREAYKGDPRVTIYQYPGCDHAFARKNGHNFQPYHADQADMRTLSFLVAKLIGHR